MNYLTTIQLYESKKNVINDIQLWSTNKTLKLPTITSCKPISYIKYASLPFYLVYCCPIIVYTDDSDTSDYFKTKLVETPLLSNGKSGGVGGGGIGLLCKVDVNTFLVFYYEDNVKMLVLKFSKFIETLPQLDIPSIPKDTLLDLKPSKRIRTNTKIIDKIIEKKKQRSNSFIANPNTTKENISSGSSILTNQDQINTAINKIIFSGLRIRGLSSNVASSLNDKLTIKEIHQMTFKATQFALRKHNYSFNKRETKKPLRLNDLQDIIENLLQLFVDIE
ncbi:hypothetical protein MEM_01915 [Candida albicans L26]|nr:hypothetical protein MEU_01903 [Candida albicans P37005]KGU15300.1 hypothetical protein MEM_01915 [Candida albicans L26]KHC58522.1 hypothetical protein MGC_01897 [Candida albicans P37039]